MTAIILFLAGCACQSLGTCAAESCRCSAGVQGAVEGGTVTDRNKLPITGFRVANSGSGNARISVHTLICADKPVCEYCGGLERLLHGNSLFVNNNLGF